MNRLSSRPGKRPKVDPRTHEPEPRPEARPSFESMLKCVSQTRDGLSRLTTTVLKPTPKAPNLIETTNPNQIRTKPQNQTQTQTHLRQLVEARVADPRRLARVRRQCCFERLLAAAVVAEDEAAVVAVVAPPRECECVLAVVALGVVLARSPLVRADGRGEARPTGDGHDLKIEGREMRKLAGLFGERANQRIRSGSRRHGNRTKGILLREKDSLDETTKLRFEPRAMASLHVHCMSLWVKQDQRPSDRKVPNELPYNEVRDANPWSPNLKLRHFPRCC